MDVERQKLKQCLESQDGNIEEPGVPPAELAGCRCGRRGCPGDAWDATDRRLQHFSPFRALAA